MSAVAAKRAVVGSLLVGVLHAALLVAVAIAIGYPIGPSAYPIVGLAWRYGGLVVVAAVPVWLALRYRLAVPVVALALTTGSVLGLELTPPGPTFRDVAELERLAGPTGILVVEDGGYVVRYMVDATVWTVGFLFAGLVEYAARTSWRWLPPVPTAPRWLSIPASPRQAATIAGVGGLLHAAVMAWSAVRIGVTVIAGRWWVLYPFATFGMWLLAAVPLYLLVRRRLVAPAALLTLFVLQDARTGVTASVDDPHAFYFGGWFVFLGVILVAAGVEAALRRVDGVRRSGTHP